MTTDLLIPAPTPLRRRLSLPRGTSEVASLTVTARVALDRSRVESAVRAVVGRFDAFRLQVVRRPGVAAPFIALGDPPDVRVVWQQDIPSPSSPTTVTLGVQTDASGTSRLTLQAPALCVDRRSLSLVLHRIVSTVTGEEADLPAQETAYLDVASWMRQLAESVDGSRAALYWRRLFPEDTLASQFFEPSGEVIDASLRVAIPPALAALPPEQREAAAALAWLRVARVMSGQPSLVLGCLTDGRLDDGLRHVVGPLSRYLPFAGGQTMEAMDAVRAAAEILIEGRQWQELFSLDDCAPDEIAGERIAGFPYVFEYEAEGAWPAPWEIEQGDADPDRSLVRLRCEERWGHLDITIRARQPGMTRGDAEVLAERWVIALQELVDLARPVASLSVLTARERAAWPWRGTLRAAEGTVHDALARACATYGDRTAIAAPEQAISFATLDRLATGLAAFLPHGRPDRVIGLHVDRSPELIVALVAILKSGAAFLPLSVQAPPAHNRRLLRQAGATLVISDRPWPDGDTPGCELFELRPAIDVLMASPPVSWTAPPVHPDHLAYVLFTSGSTGEPVGAAVSHRAVLNLAMGLRDAIPELCERRRVGMNGPISFDTSIKQLVQLLDGHTLVLIPEETRRDPVRLASYLDAQEIEAVDFTPSHLALVEDAVAMQAATPPPPRLLLLGGEPVRRPARGRGTHAYNVYGLTECTVDSLVGALDAASSPDTLGPPLANTEVFVTDPRGDLVPDGVVGELHIAGMGLARGYVGAPALTAARFLPNPFGDGRRAYRTGDLVSRQPGGALRFRGRSGSGSVVKIRGHRVSPREVEAAVEAVPGVARAVVASRPTAAGAAQLVAWVVPTQPYAPIVDGQVRITLPDGLSVAGLSRHETIFLHGEVFVRNAYLRHGLSLPDGACVIDVGANIGLFSLRAHLAARDVRLIALEPHPEAYACLRANAKIFGLSGYFLPLGVGRTRATRAFTRYRGFSLLSGFHADPDADLAVVRDYIRHQRPDENGADENGADEGLLGELLADRFDAVHERREVVTLFDVMRDYAIARVDLLKVNVEKSEAEVLEGILPDDWPRIQQVALEVHDLDGRLDRLVRLLETQGFGVEVEKDWSLPGADAINYYVYAARPNRVRAADAPPPAVDALPTPLTERAITRALAAQCPDFQVPSRIVILDRLPLTDHGKVDRAALEATLAEANRAASLDAPRTPLEADLLAAWQEILDRRDIGVGTLFLDEGGDSFAIMQMNLRLRRLCGIELPVVDMFQHPTIRLLAQHITDLRLRTH